MLPLHDVFTVKNLLLKGSLSIEYGNVSTYAVEDERYALKRSMDNSNNIFNDNNNLSINSICGYFTH